MNKDMAVTKDGGAYGGPYVVEGYGIIYNNAIMNKYIALPNAKSPFGITLTGIVLCGDVIDKVTVTVDGTISTLTTLPLESYATNGTLSSLISPSSTTKTSSSFEYEAFIETISSFRSLSSNS